MASTSITIKQDQLLISLGQVSRSVADTDDMLRVVGAYMYGSVMRTYTEEGSPAGSWPELAASTRKKKGYTAGHKLLVLRGLLKNSIGFRVVGNSVTIGSFGVAYAQVQFQGSADRQGGQAGGGPKQDRDRIKVSAYDSLRVRPFRQYGKDQRTGKDGKARNVRVRAQGPDGATRFKVGEHERHQNIPARNPLVFRPEDPGKIISGIDAYIRQRSPAVKP